MEESSTESTRSLNAQQKKLHKKKKKGLQAQQRKKLLDASEVNNIYERDPNQLDLIKGISSMELLNIAEKFDQYPGEELDCH